MSESNNAPNDSNFVPVHHDRDIFDTAPVGVFTTTPEGRIISANAALSRMFGYESPEEMIASVTDIAAQAYDDPADREKLIRLLEEHGEVSDRECRFRRRDGSELWGAMNVRAVKDEDERIVAYQGFNADITKQKQAEEKLERLEWMLSGKSISDIETQAETYDQGYGDLTGLNRDGIILKSIGRRSLESFANDYLQMLGTSSAIYEANGDYALGIFTSGWCRMMDSASRRLCNTPDNAEALESGRWLCHESCWTDSSKRAIAECAPVDIACNGGIRMYAVPILANGKVVGAMNIGYGNPPKDPEQLRMLSEAFHLDYEDLVRKADAYDSRPPFIIELAKKRLHATARLIGSMIETRQTREGLEESERRFQRMLGVVPDMISIQNPEMDILYSNWHGFAAVPENRRILYTKCHKTYRNLDDVCPDCLAKSVLENREPIHEEAELPDGKWVDIRVIPILDQDNNVEMFMEWVRDITEHKQAEKEKETLQSQLLQAQKMESVGRLAGGVAHDFNNMLGVVLGHTEMALEHVDPEQPLYNDLKEVHKTAERSASLTRQLLTFARKQTIEPRVIDLNETVEGMRKMLGRLIGEDIDLSWLPGKNLAPVKMDPSQIDQILANLCVNARDAIADVGKITIETDSATFDQAYCDARAGFVPGEYVMLAVSDNGCGMDQETVSHLFEPFFTTKEQGKGTGLGLASVYGAVKQNNGFINIYSEPDQGTTVKIYMPKHQGENTPVQAEKAALEQTESGSETILLVEDDPSILRMATMMLERQGYVVIVAESPGDAVNLAHEQSGTIDLLMTDVVMPEMNGRDLAKSLKAYYPTLKVLFMSGYTSNVIAHHGVLDQGVAFIQKPFSLKDLGGKLREVLEDKNGE